MTDKKAGSGRLRASYITSIISITLVLFMLGLLGMIILHGKKLSDYIRENISISVMLKDNVSDEQVLYLDSNILASFPIFLPLPKAWAAECRLGLLSRPKR